MDFARLALRLAAIETLVPTDKPSGAPWPTLAGPVVMDSQIEPTDERLIAEKQPMIGVFTDDDAAQPYGTGVDILHGADGTVTLSFEVAVPMRLPPQGTSPSEPVLYGVTNAQIEARLDLVCGQITQALRNGLAGGLLSEVVRSFLRRESHTYRDADTDTRLSARRLDYTVAVKDSAVPGDPTAVGLARLPQPLQAVALRLPPGSYGRSICDALAVSVPGGLALSPLQGIGLEAWVDRPDPVPDEPDLKGDIPTL